MQHLNDYGEEIYHEFRAVQKEFKDYISPLVKKKGFTMTQSFLISILSDHPNITLNELSERVGFSKSTVSVAIEQLVEKGAVVRIVPMENRRCVHLSVNNDIMCIIDELKAENGLFSEINKNLSGIEAEQMISSLKKLRLSFASAVEHAKNMK